MLFTLNIQLFPLYHPVLAGVLLNKCVVQVLKSHGPYILLNITVFGNELCILCYPSCTVPTGDSVTAQDDLFQRLPEGFMPSSGRLSRLSSQVPGQ